MRFPPTRALRCIGRGHLRRFSIAKHDNHKGQHYRHRQGSQNFLSGMEGCGQGDRIFDRRWSLAQRNRGFAADEACRKGDPQFRKRQLPGVTKM
jgi:hypothetical protein